MSDTNGTSNGTARRRKADISAGADKPPCPPVLPDGIPDALKPLPRWVCWQWEQRPDKKTGGTKWTKPPINPLSATASHADVASGKRLHWATFADALKALQSGRGDGVGFVFTKNEEYCGVDLDDCRDALTGVLDPEAAAIVAELASYTEVSPSGTGVKIFLKGKKPDGGSRKGDVEIYSVGRYFTMTGNRVDGTPATLEDRQAELDRFHARVFKPAEKPRRPAAPGNGDGNSSGDDLVFLSKRMDRDAKLCALWAGNTGAYDNDANRADMALAMKLAFYLQRDPNRIDAAFRHSGLMRSKWDEAHYSGGETYGLHTINRAISLCSEVYNPPIRGRRGKFHSAPKAESSTSSNGAGGGGQGDDGHEKDIGPSGYDLIFAYFRDHYQPTFRRSNALFSGRLGREIKRSEACSDPGKELAKKLEDARDVPFGKQGVDVNAIPPFFRNWAGSAWKDLLESLPDEQKAVEVSGHARDIFRSQVMAALHTLVALTYRYEGSDGDEREEVQRRSMIGWCRFIGKGAKKRWEDIRSHCIWIRRDDPEQPLRVELFSQLHRADLASLSPEQFRKLCELYDVGTQVKVRGGNERAIELLREFLCEVVAEPESDENPDSRTADTRARVREWLSYCPGWGSNA